MTTAPGQDSEPQRSGALAVFLKAIWAVLFETIAHPFTTSVVRIGDGRVRTRRLKGA